MTVQEIQREITQLPPAELAELTEWFEEFVAHIWDKQIAQDLEDGKLDLLLQQWNTPEEDEAWSHLAQLPSL